MRLGTRFTYGMLFGIPLFVIGCAGGGNGSLLGNGVAKNPAGTTLLSTVSASGRQTTGSELAYRATVPGAPWPLVVREDLAEAKPGRESRRRSLLSFVHLTDMHIIDPQSPGRFPYLRKGDGSLPGGLNFDDAFRAQEPFTAHVSEAMVRKVNTLSGGPAEGKPFSFAISTGDNGDWKSRLELQNYLNLLNGGPITVNTSGEGYVGVMDDYVHPGEGGRDIYRQYWHPNPPPAGMQRDDWKLRYGFPEIPGLLQAATQNFTATGLRMPWYSANGNHDGLIGANFPDVPQYQDFLNGLATGNIPGYGSQMLLDLPPGVSKTEFVEALSDGTGTALAQYLPDMPKRPVPQNLGRLSYDLSTFLQMHLASGGQPTGHGFTSENVANNTAYYTFDMGSGFTGITLDTVNRSGHADGSIGQKQVDWLEARLKELAPFYFDEGGQRVETGRPGRFVVLFSHHNSETMRNLASLPFDPDPQKLSGERFVEILRRYPNVILWVNGHSHFNRVWVHPDPKGHGLWEVNTASHVDWPQQARTMEILDNEDGTLSVFGVLIDHMGATSPNYGDLSLLGIAGISRELSANDPVMRRRNATGGPKDRNVELLIRKPFNLPTE